MAGQLENSAQLMRERPFREPHHSCSAAALLGGGCNPRPGELSLAHGGVLFLDELAEFRRAVLDQLRQPLEEGWVRLSRAHRNTVFPASITLVAATNPCPCGWHGDREHGCRCSTSQRQRYWQRLSGPLLDRLDLQLRLERRNVHEVKTCMTDPIHATKRSHWIEHARIDQARQRMHLRNPGGGCNRLLSAHALRSIGRFQPSALKLWEQLIDHRGLTTRSGLQLLRVARTIADLNNNEDVQVEDVAEASCFRCSDLIRQSIAQ